MRKREHEIEVSVIIPVYNAERYLAACVDSLLRQGDLRMEIILVDDGSTDLSGEIADEYARKEERIKVIHQENGGASAARNAGLDIAQGGYIALLDSDDWIRDGALALLYNEAIRYQADVVMGNMWLCDQEGSVSEPFLWFAGESPHEVLSGKEGFIRLVSTCFYLPTPVRYIYSGKYLRRIRARFEEGIMHEDELWCPVVLCQAERMVITGIGFYYYRQNEASVMHTTHLYRRLRSLFRVTEGLTSYAERLTFEDGDLKSWWYVNLYRLYSWAFTYLGNIRDSSREVPAHRLDRFWRDCGWMSPEAVVRCRDYYRIAEEGLRAYTDWRMSDGVASVACQIRQGKKVMLVFNTIKGEDLRLNVEGVPVDWVITTDRKYFRQAAIVVFHLLSLRDELEDDLDKLEGQTWANWYLENESEEVSATDPDVMGLFDVSIPFSTFEDCINKLIGS